MIAWGKRLTSRDSIDMKIRINISAWRGHVETMFKATIPSLLAEGNLPTLVQSHDISIDICTSPQTNIDAIETCGLQDFADVSIHRVRLTRNAHRSFTRMQNVTVGKAMDEAAGCIFLCPDMILADGTLAWLSSRVQDAMAVVVPGILRTNKEVVMPLIENDGVLCIKPRDLIAMFLANRHAATTSLNAENLASKWPSMLYWDVPNQGVVCKCFHAHPIYVMPTGQIADTIDGSFLQNCENIVYANSSDDIAIIELSRESHMSRTIGEPVPINEWANRHALPVHRQHAQQTFRCVAVMTDGFAWQSTERRADLFIREAMCVSA